MCLIATSNIEIDNREDCRQKQITCLNKPEFIYSYLVIYNPYLKTLYLGFNECVLINWRKKYTYVFNKRKIRVINSHITVYWMSVKKDLQKNRQ